MHNTREPMAISPMPSVSTVTPTVTSTTVGASPEPETSANPVGRITPAAAPGNLSAVYTTGEATVTWAVPDLAGGQLVHYLVSGTDLADKTVTTTATIYTDLPAGTTITFTVRAITRVATGQTLMGAPASKTLNTPSLPTITITRGSETDSPRCERPDCPG